MDCAKVVWEKLIVQRKCIDNGDIFFGGNGENKNNNCSQVKGKSLWREGRRWWDVGFGASSGNFTEEFFFLMKKIY
jgi:hypothetical protein